MVETKDKFNVNTGMVLESTYHTCDTPDINLAPPIAAADNGFRRTILPRLDFLRVMTLRRRRISKVSYLNGNRLENRRY